MPCPYCSMPMTSTRRVQCGAPACVRRYNAERTIKAARESKARNGFWRSQIERICITCGKTWMADSSGTTQCCSRECTNAMRYGGPLEREARAKQRKRRDKNWITRTRRLALYERDAWMCHICGDEVNRDVVVPALDAPTLDHIIARVCGGTDDDDNLHTAHFYCNSVKRERPLAIVACV